jgi:hypothetical protein
MLEAGFGANPFNKLEIRDRVIRDGGTGVQIFRR